MRVALWNYSDREMVGRLMTDDSIRRWFGLDWKTSVAQDTGYSPPDNIRYWRLDPVCLPDGELAVGVTLIRRCALGGHVTLPLGIEDSGGYRIAPLSCRRASPAVSKQSYYSREAEQRLGVMVHNIANTSGEGLPRTRLRTRAGVLAYRSAVLSSGQTVWQISPLTLMLLAVHKGGDGDRRMAMAGVTFFRPSTKEMRQHGQPAAAIGSPEELKGVHSSLLFNPSWAVFFCQRQKPAGTPPNVTLPHADDVMESLKLYYPNEALLTEMLL